MPVTREMVRAAFLLILGREPESEVAVETHMGFSDPIALGTALRTCAEYRAKNPYQFPVAKWVAVDVLDKYIQWIDLADGHVSRGCMNNSWEPSETEYFISKLHEGDVVLDIGANVGWFSLVAAKYIGAKGKVHAFEPRPDTGRALARTIADNALGNVIKFWPYALTDRAGTVELAWAPNSDNPGGSHLVGKSRPVGAASASVQAAPLDELLPDVAPDVVKMDIEGAEPLAIRGMVKALSRSRPPILSELHTGQLKQVSNTSPREYIELLSSLGYACYLLENGRPGERLEDFPERRAAPLVSVVFEARAGV